MKKILVAPSILSADFARLSDEIKRIEDAGADLIHVDVMDGRFVPNITIGPLIVEAVKRCTKLPLDVHLMIDQPHKLLKAFADAGSDIITVHAETYTLGTSDKQQATRVETSRSVDKIDEVRVKKVLSEIKSLGKKAGLSLNPDSSFCIEGVLGEVDMILLMSVHPGFGGQKFIDSVIPKIKQARKLYAGDIEVDGGINDKNVKLVLDAGANVIVAGSYFFGAKDAKEAVRKLHGGK
ncbi:MAG: ribulose-phosphate 3-epimerase [Candidatus Gorgyraea atricola]|nr:ribulose-phosphate 3-epimerase [Candidatus Gorgyraea atricola]